MKTRVIAGALVLLLAYVAGSVFASHIRADERREIGYRAALDSAVVYGLRADSLGRVFRVQHDTVTVRVTRWRETAARVDTAFLHDTVAVPVEVVREVVRTADSTITACTLALATCDERHVADSAQAVQLRRALTLVPKPRAAWKTWGERLGWAALVVLTAK